MLFVTEIIFHLREHTAVRQFFGGAYFRLRLWQCSLCALCQRVWSERLARQPQMGSTKPCHLTLFNFNLIYKRLFCQIQ